jgi:hypothetical protein
MVTAHAERLLLVRLRVAFFKLDVLVAMIGKLPGVEEAQAGIGMKPDLIAVFVDIPELLLAPGLVVTAASDARPSAPSKPGISPSHGNDGSCVVPGALHRHA